MASLLAYLAAHTLLAVGMVVLARRAPSLRWLLLVGIALRLVAACWPPFTTHDVARYLWDGAVALLGLDPYRLTPSDAAVASLHASWPSPVEHARYPTLYPPLALSLFALCATAGPLWGVWAWKLACAAASVALLLVASRSMDRRAVAILALHPLLVLEGSLGAHVDVVSALALLLALHAHGRAQVGRVGLFLGLGVLIKLLPGLALVPLWVATSGPQRLRLLAFFVGTVALGYGLALALGWHPIGSLPVFMEKWRFGQPLSLGFRLEVTQARFLLGAGIVVGLGFATVLAQRGEVAWAVLVALALPLMVSPVVFPWYLLPLVVLLPSTASRGLLAWSLLLPLTYEVLVRFWADGTWEPARWPLVLVGVGMLVGFSVDGRALWGRVAAFPQRSG